MPSLVPVVVVFLGPVVQSLQCKLESAFLKEQEYRVSGDRFYDKSTTTYMEGVVRNDQH